jgi:hypothetical protein
MGSRRLDADNTVPNISATVKPALGASIFYLPVARTALPRQVSPVDEKGTAGDKRSFV